jgi:hypothetical protein
MPSSSQVAMLRPSSADEASDEEEISNQEIINLVRELSGNAAQGSFHIENIIRNGGSIDARATGFTIRPAGDGKQEVVILHHQEQSTNGEPSSDVYTALTLRQAKYVGLYADFRKHIQTREEGTLPITRRQKSTTVPPDNPKLDHALTKLKNAVKRCCG